MEDLAMKNLNMKNEDVVNILNSDQAQLEF